MVGMSKRTTDEQMEIAAMLLHSAVQRLRIISSKKHLLSDVLSERERQKRNPKVKASDSPVG